MVVLLMTIIFSNMRRQKCDFKTYIFKSCTFEKNYLRYLSGEEISGVRYTNLNSIVSEILSEIVSKLLSGLLSELPPLHRNSRVDTTLIKKYIAR